MNHTTEAVYGILVKPHKGRVEARKLECDRPLIPKHRKEGKPIHIPTVLEPTV